MSTVPNHEVILPDQMCTFWKKVREGLINKDIFQAFLNNVGAFTIPRGVYYNLSSSQKSAAHILRHDFLGINLVINALQWKGISINLSESELGKYSDLFLTETSLTEIEKRGWRGKRAILWWAPPERYGLNLKKLFDTFGADNKYQPCFYKDAWWLNEPFAYDVLPEGWHITLVELPVETKSRSFADQLQLKDKEEMLCKPIELAFLCFINYIIKQEYILNNFYSRTDIKMDNDHTAAIGKFESEGLRINKISSSLSTQEVPIGLLFSRNPSIVQPKT